MSTSRRRFLTATGALGGAIAVPRLARASAYDPQPLGGTVTIGVAGPFSGDSSQMGEQIANGVRAATNDANSFRGTLDRAFALQTFDDQNLVAQGIQEASFANDAAEVVAVVGHLSGRVTEAAMPTYVQGGMPVICPASTYDRLTQHGWNNLFRLATKDSIEGQAAAKYVIANAKPASTVTLVQDGDYGIDVAQGFAAESQAEKVGNVALVFPWKSPKFDQVVAGTIAKKPDAVFLAGLASEMGPVVPLLRAAGYAGPLFASQGFFAPAVIEKYGKDVEGLTVSTSMPPLVLAPTAFRVLTDYQRQYGAMTPLAAFGYAAAQIVIAIVRRTNAADRVAVLRAFNPSPVFNTVVGTFTFADTGDPQQAQTYFYGVRNGAWKYLASAYPSTFVVK